MNRAQRRAAAKAPKPALAFSTPFGVAVIDSRRPMTAEASAAALALAKARPLREEQRNRLRAP